MFRFIHHPKTPLERAQEHIKKLEETLGLSHGSGQSTRASLTPDNGKSAYLVRQNQTNDGHGQGINDQSDEAAHRLSGYQSQSETASPPTPIDKTQ